MAMTLPAQHEVTIWDVTHTEVSTMLTSLVDQGLRVDHDFEFGFHPAWANYQDGAGPNRRSVVWRFRDPVWATWLRLRHP